MSVQKWWEVYAGDAEKRVFVGKKGNGGLCRHRDYKWRSLESLAGEAELTKKEVEVILSKYMKMGLVFQNDSGDKFGYWENVQPDKADPPKAGPVEADQKDRMKKAGQKI